MMDAVLAAEPLLVLVALMFFITRPAYAPQALLLALVPWGVRLAKHGRLTRYTFFALPLALFFGSALIGVWAAYDAQAAWQKFWLITGGVLLYFAILNGRRSANRLGGARSSNWALLFSLLGAGLSLYFITQHDYTTGAAKFAAISTLGIWLHGHAPQIGGETFHPNVIGGILAVILPLSVANVWHWLHPAKRGYVSSPHYPLFLLSVVVALIVAFGLLMSQSRGAWLALAVAGGVWGMGRVRERWVRLGDVLAAGVIVAAGLLLFVRPERSAVAVDRWIGVIPAGDTAIDRLTLYHGGRYLVEETLFTGGGLASFPMRYSTYILDIPVLKLTHAHNLYLDVWLEQGLVGILSLVGMIVATAWYVWKRPLHRSIFLSAATVSLGTLLLHGLVDDVLYSSRALPLLFVPFALILRHALVQPQREPAQPVEAEPEEEPVLSWWRRRPLYGAALAALALAILGGVVFRAPVVAAYHADLGVVAQGRAELGCWPDVAAQDVRREGDLSAAIAEYTTALENDAANRVANHRLGAIALARGDYAQAARLLERAYRAGLGEQVVRGELAIAYVATGQTAKALPLLHAMPDAVSLLAEQRTDWAKDDQTELLTRLDAVSLALLDRREVEFTSQFDGTTQMFLLVPPQGSGKQPPPLVVYLHSLGNDPFEYLRLRTGTAHAENLAVYLSHRGVVAAAPAYRGDSWGSDAALADISQIIRQVQGSYGKEPVIVSGFSMGATAALAYALLAPDDIPLQGVVTALGASDLELLWDEGNLRGSITKGLGVTPLEDAEAYDARSAARHPERFGTDVAVAILSAKSDTTIPPYQQTALQEKLKAQGTPLLFLTSEGGHSPEGLHFRQAFDFVLDR